jgi:hypothetical protein
MYRYIIMPRRRNLSKRKKRTQIKRIYKRRTHSGGKIRNRRRTRSGGKRRNRRRTRGGYDADHLAPANPTKEDLKAERDRLGEIARSFTGKGDEMTQLSALSAMDRKLAGTETHYEPGTHKDAGDGWELKNIQDHVQR